MVKVKEEKKYKRGVMPGRFQPLHHGHLHVVEWALQRVEKILLVIGSAQDSFSFKNPLTAGERYEILERVIEKRGWKQRIDIVPVMDINSNKQWVKYLEMLLPRFDVGISGNPLVQLLFLDSGYDVLEPPMYRREECSGTIIRRRIVEGKEWRNCVPEETIELLEQFGFPERLKRLAGGG
ncbi:MAG: nicotinamide-nucleotide adenylyltransferase [Desulfurococcales archaeon]|nr:nicotinamide-nucleotide adenylyltransferase [Desulfurococcales archaeon]